MDYAYPLTDPLTKEGALEFTATFRSVMGAYKEQHRDIQSQMAVFEDLQVRFNP